MTFNFFKQYFEKREREFLKNVGRLRRRMRVYSGMEFLERDIRGCNIIDEDLVYRVKTRTCKSYAIIEYCNCLSTLDRARFGGVDRAVKVLEELDKENVEWGFVK